jgi:hypothetical protein
MNSFKGTTIVSIPDCSCHDEPYLHQDAFSQHQGMRMTIDLDQAVLRQVRKRALEGHRTMSQVVEEALIRFLRQPAEAKNQIFTLITGGRLDDIAPAWEAVKQQMVDEDDASVRRVADADAP